MKRFSFRILFFLAGLLFVLFLLSPDLVQRSAHESVLFCASVLIPSLFPCFVLTEMLVSLSVSKAEKGSIFFRLFCLPSVMSRCWILGLLAGFPTAAECTVRMVHNRVVSKEQGERCLAFTNNPGIVFVVCAVGSGIFGSFKIGFFLWGIQTVSSIIVGMMLANPSQQLPCKDSEDMVVPPLRKILPASVLSSVSAVLNICGFVVFFRVLIDVLTCAVPTNTLKTLFAGLLEMTCGVCGLREFGLISAVMTALILGWSGLSVHFQILSVTASEDLSLRYYFPGKALQAIFSACLTVGVYPIFFSGEELSVGFSGACILLGLAVPMFFRFRKEFVWKKKFLIKKRAD